MKITLIYPGIAYIGFNSIGKGVHDTNWLNLGLAYIGAYLKNNGVEVDLIDLREMTGWNEVEQEMVKRNPDVFGIYLNTINFKFGVECARIAKKMGKKVIVGGPHATIAPQEALQTGVVDHVVIGEGEKATLQIVEDIENGKKPPEIIHGLRTDNIDELPFPDRDLYNLDRILNAPFAFPFPENGLTILGSRGCPFQCAFCQPLVKDMFGHRIRYRSVENVISEMKYLIDKYRVRYIHFDDDTLTARKSWVLNLCRRLREEKVKVHWSAQTRVDTIDDEQAAALRKSGCFCLFIGFESGSQRILDFLKKGIMPQQSIKAAEICRRNGILIFANYMLGMPGETIEDMEKTYELFKKIRPEVLSPAYFTPVPGSDMFNYCKDRDLILIKSHEDFIRNAVGEKVKGVDYCLVKEYEIKISSCNCQWFERLYFARMVVKRWLCMWKRGEGRNALGEFKFRTMADAKKMLQDWQVNISIWFRHHLLIYRKKEVSQDLPNKILVIDVNHSGYPYTILDNLQKKYSGAKVILLTYSEKLCSYREDRLESTPLTNVSYQVITVKRPVGLANKLTAVFKYIGILRKIQCEKTVMLYEDFDKDDSSIMECAILINYHGKCNGYEAQKGEFNLSQSVILKKIGLRIAKPFSPLVTLIARQTVSLLHIWERTVQAMQRKIRKKEKMGQSSDVLLHSKKRAEKFLIMLWKFIVYVITVPLVLCFWSIMLTAMFFFEYVVRERSPREKKEYIYGRNNIEGKNKERIDGLVTVTIVNWNGKEYIATCLSSIYSQTYKNIECIVVDNYSIDDSVGIIKNLYPQVRLIQNPSNSGFSRAHNQAIKEAQGEYILILNFDTVLEKDFIEKIIKVFRHDNTIGSIAPKLIKSKNPEGTILDSTGITMKHMFPHDRGQDEIEDRRYNESGPVFGVTGACAFYRHKTLEDIKVDGEWFDEDFGLYVEDVDLAWRAQLRGWKCYYLPDTVAFHKRGVTRINKPDIVRDYYITGYRNRYLAILKNAGIKDVLYNLGTVFSSEINFWRNVLCSKHYYAIRSMPNFIPLLFVISKKRRGIQVRRRVNVKEMTQWFFG